MGFYSYFSENSCRLHLKMLVMRVRVVRLNKTQNKSQIKIKPSRSDLIWSMGDIIKEDTVHSWLTCCCVIEEHEQTAANSRMKWSVIQISLAVSRSSEQLLKLPWDAFTGDKPPGNGILVSLGSVVQTVGQGRQRINNHHFHSLFIVWLTDDLTSSEWKAGEKRWHQLGAFPVP